jgi:replicative DNA helicase
LTKAVDRIIQLNSLFSPKHIYVDRGFGEVQVELLRKHGVENPSSKLKERVRGVSFAETIEVRDPYTKLMVKKEIKPFMVDNLRQYLEKEEILFSEHDEELYMQLISYVVVRTTSSGRPVFEAGGSAMDHAHDALILALLAVTQNYGEFSKTGFASNVESFSNEAFLNNLMNNKDDSTESSNHIISGRAQALSVGNARKSIRSGTRITRKTF